jgi:cytochrome c553
MLAMPLLFCLPILAVADGLGDENAPPQEVCGTCHGLNGISRMAKFPKLAGQRAEYVEKQVRDFREGRRGNDGGQMATAATEIREDQVAEVARYFAAQPPPEPQVAALEVSANGRAESLFTVGDARADIAPCGHCHSPATHRVEARLVGPLLSSQHESYIAKQLRDFRSGSRANDTERVMQRIARRLGDDDIAALARYLALMPREAKAHE